MDKSGGKRVSAQGKGPHQGEEELFYHLGLDVLVMRV